MEIENPLRRGDRRSLAGTLVDTGAELTWAPRDVLESLGITRQKRLGFRTADGRAVYRDIGYAIVHAGGTETNDEVVFAEPGDMILLGARSLEGLNLRVDSRRKQLVDAGPIVAAGAVASRNELATLGVQGRSCSELRSDGVAPHNPLSYFPPSTGETT